MKPLYAVLINLDIVVPKLFKLKKKKYLCVCISTDSCKSNPYNSGSYCVLKIFGLQTGVSLRFILHVQIKTLPPVGHMIY
jgi:hypothetical protein